MTVPQKSPLTPAGEIMEQVLLKGDIAKLTPQERVSYYNEVCRSMGLNPLTTPFEFIVLNGKMRLYALRSCTDQLRKINSVSLEIVSKELTDDILTVHVRAKLPEGRFDEDLGAVSFPPTLKGEARANAELKCITKAKRRATLSICGLGWLDETEVEDIPAVAKRPTKPAPNVMLVEPEPHDPETGELPYPSPQPFTAADPDASARPPQDERAGASGDLSPPKQSAPARAGKRPAPVTDKPTGAGMSIEDMGREAAMRGEQVFNAFYKLRSQQERKRLAIIGEELRNDITKADDEIKRRQLADIDDDEIAIT